MDSLLKLRYGPEAIDWLNHDKVLLDHLQRNTTSISVDGKTFTLAMIDNYNQSVQATDETSTLPTAGYVSSTTAVVPQRYQVGQIRFSEVVMEASRTNRGAFAKAARLEMKYMLKGMSNDVNRQLFGNGTGALCYWTAADDVSPFTVDDNQVLDQQYAMKDMLIDVYDVDDDTTILNSTNGFTISAITGTTLTAAAGVDGLSGTADGDYAVRHGTRKTSGTLGLEMMGLKGIVALTDPPLLASGLQGKARSGNAQWQAGSGNGVFTSVGDITEDAIQQAVDVVEDWGTVKLILTSKGVRRQYLNYLVGDRRYVNIMKFGGGFSALEYNGIPIVTDKHCQKKTMYVLDTDVLALYTLSNVKWMDSDGHVLHRTGTTMEYQATLRWFMELGVKDCQPLAVLQDINES